VDKIEITQSQQFLNNATHADNSLPAVDRRTTTVRAYIKRTGGSPFVPTSGIQGRLRVFDGATQIFDMLSDNGPISAGGLILFPSPPPRENASATLNFTFVPTGGSAFFGRTLTFTVTVDPFNTISEGNEGNNELTMGKGFNCRRAPLFIGVPINYTAATETDASTLGLPDPNLIGQGVGDAFLWGAYPFPEYVPGASGRYRLFNGPALNWATNIDSSGSALLTQLNTMRVGMSPVPDFIYGWFRGNPFNSNGLGFVGVGAAFGNTDPARHQRTFAHETGHNFGFQHNRTEAGLFLTAIGETGWDTLDRVGLGFLKSNTLQDIMVPGLLTHEAWVHPQTYQDVHDTVTNSCFVLPPFTPIELMVISAILPPNPGDPWIMQPAFQIRSVAVPPAPVQKGRGQVRVLGRDGKQLYLTAFDASSPGDSKEEGGRALSLVLPAMAEAAAVEIMYDGVVREVLKRSPNPPKVAIGFAQGGPDGLALSWRAEDADGDPLEVMVRYSPDGGQSFIPIAVRPRGSDLRIPADRLPASGKGSLEVLVSDGFNTSVAMIDGLQVGRNHAPTVALVKPHEGDVFHAGANVVMLSSTDDAEDGAIAPERILWSSDRDGLLGTGPALNSTALSQGPHLLTVQATDSQGASAQASVKIAVR
jgi:hypothetical protein